MKISEAINKLLQYLKEVGDVELVNIEDFEEQGFMISGGKDLQIVELPNADETAFEVVVALVEPMEPVRPKLSLVKND